MKFIGILLFIAATAGFVYWIWYAKSGGKKDVGEKVKGVREFDILVKGAYSPSTIKAKQGEKIKINFLRKESSSCSKMVVFSDFSVRKELPENKKVTIELNLEKKGEFKFTCDMGMYQGKLIVE